MKIVATSFLFVCLALSIISFGQNSLNKVDAVAVRFKALMESIFIQPTGIQLAPLEIDFMEVLRGAGAAM